MKQLRLSLFPHYDAYWQILTLVCSWQHQMKSSRRLGNGNPYVEVNGDEYLGGDGKCRPLIRLVFLCSVAVVSARSPPHVEKKITNKLKDNYSPTMPPNLQFFMQILLYIQQISIQFA